jgi:hypothetical protein
MTSYNHLDKVVAISAWRYIKTHPISKKAKCAYVRKMIMMHRDFRKRRESNE